MGVLFHRSCSPLFRSRPHASRQTFVYHSRVQEMSDKCLKTGLEDTTEKQLGSRDGYQAKHLQEVGWS